MQHADQLVADARTVANATSSSPLLDVSDLTVTFPGAAGPVQVVRGLSYSIARGETLGIVGESGCGKTMTSLALLGLIAGGKVGGTIGFNGSNLASFSQRQWQQLRGRDIAMIFQEPMTAMNPVMQVGRQIGEVLTKHEKLSRRWRRSVPSTFSHRSEFHRRPGGPRITRISCPAACASAP